MAESRVFHTRIKADEKDRPLHRIFPLWRFEEVLRLRKLTLVKPSQWDDPREDPCAAFYLQSQKNPKRRMLELAGFLAPAWAQCWSFEANSDVLLRAYSRVMLDSISQRNTDPANEGVRVTTTPRKLIAAAETWAERAPDRHFFVARVIYEKDEAFGQTLANKLANPAGPKVFSTPQGRADSLFVKRDMFQQEDEVRLLCIGPGRHHEGEALQRFDIDPNALFDEVRFDPRLISFERREREDMARKWGYEGKVLEDPAYMKVLTTIPVPYDWEDPE